ncbi:ATP synthase subunit f, mitochondrial [Sciurus carolinensis]|uniref:ATP synthase F(0) complex subunit f, mitochondrial n=1 Tax=Sciurus carolinensis TaxID=30640 RepID=A0AA41T3U5_SCICA|nr:ATP synthase subunit f, mitochondrial [Sciurus carolinensis]
MKEKKLMDVKLGEFPSWILMGDFTPKGIMGAYQRGYHQYCNKYINVKKGNIAGVNMMLAVYVFSATAFLTRNSNISGDTSTTEEGPVWTESILCTPHWDCLPYKELIWSHV